MSPPRSTGQPPAASVDRERVLDQFEEAWRSGKTPPRIEAYLPSAAARELLEGLIKIDLNYRWSQAQRGASGRIDWTAPRRESSEGQPPGSAPQCLRLEDYVQHFPNLGRLDQLSLGLIEEEYRVRQRWGDRPAQSDYLARFPGHGAMLPETLSRIDAELAAEAAGTEKVALASSPIDHATPSAGAPAPAQPVATVTDLVKALGTSALLNPAQQQELAETLQGRFSDPRSLAKELLQRGWVTPYQVNQLLQGRGHELVLGPYMLLERLGEGGAGQVFKARHQRMNRTVALKVIRKELLADSEVVSRFYREIQVVSQLTHPNVVHAYDAGPIGRTHVLVMEFVEGIDLGRLVKQSGPLPVSEACEYVRQAALGLQHAHERGLVHRDIKPPNLMRVTGKGLVASPDQVASASSLATSHQPLATIKILDLGLARLRQKADGGEGNSLVTPHGSVMMGTPDFLAPEQALDFHAADIRADIYSLGCTFYYLLTGRPPFPGGSLAQKIAKHMQEEPSAIEQLRADVPAAVGKILSRMLAKRLEDRYQTPQDVAEALAVWLAQGGQQPRRRRRLLATALGAVLALGLAAVFLLPLVRPRASPTSASADKKGLSPLDQLNARNIPAAKLPAQRPAELVAVLGDFRSGPHNQQFRLAFSPRDWTLASASESKVVRLWNFTGAEQPETRDLKGHSYPVAAIAFSADGTLLASGSADRTARVWDLVERQPTAPLVLQHENPVCGLAFHPDGKTLASVCTYEKTVHLWNVAGVVSKKDSGLTADSPALCVAFAPDGKMLACGTTGQKVGLWDLSGPKPVERGVLVTGSSVIAVAFSPDGKRVASVSGGIVTLAWVADFAGPKSKKQFELKQRGRVSGFAFAPDGQTIVTADSERWVTVWDAGSGKSLREFQAGEDMVRIGLAADGRHLATASTNGTVSIFRLAPRPG
jgi:serine/threonine-protein kinase